MHRVALALMANLGPFLSRAFNRVEFQFILIFIFALGAPGSGKAPLVGTKGTAQPPFTGATLKIAISGNDPHLSNASPMASWRGMW
jgi:hypothetical protein